MENTRPIIQKLTRSYSSNNNSSWVLIIGSCLHLEVSLKKVSLDLLLHLKKEKSCCLLNHRFVFSLADCLASGVLHNTMPVNWLQECIGESGYFYVLLTLCGNMQARQLLRFQICDYAIVHFLSLCFSLGLPTVTKTIFQGYYHDILRLRTNHKV